MKTINVVKGIGRIVAFVVMASAMLCRASSTDLDQEHQIKAALIANFINFIDWPDLGPPGSKFIVGVYGADDFDSAIEQQLAGKTVLGHQIVVQQIHTDAEMKKCRIVVSGATSEDRIYHLQHICEGSGTVLIGEADDFARSGGAIGLLMVSSHVKFDVNLAAAKRAGVTISTKLLQYAHEVIKEGSN